MKKDELRTVMLIRSQILITGGSENYANFRDKIKPCPIDHTISSAYVHARRNDQKLVGWHNHSEGIYVRAEFFSKAFSGNGNNKILW